MYRIKPIGEHDYADTFIVSGSKQSEDNNGKDIGAYGPYRYD
jgi:hypothetical protein